MRFIDMYEETRFIWLIYIIKLIRHSNIYHSPAILYYNSPAVNNPIPGFKIAVVKDMQL